MATYSFLPGVLVLARSIRRTWTEQPIIYVALLDGFDLARPGFEDLDDVVFVDAATLDIPNFPWLCLKYSAYELSCAVKPFIVRHALRQSDASVWYVDADIAFFADPGPMRAMLASHNIVVTPHIVEAPTDENRWRAPTVGHLAAAGLLNAGMFASRPSEDTARFLDAWSRMVTEPGAFLWDLATTRNSTRSIGYSRWSQNPASAATSELTSPIGTSPSDRSDGRHWTAAGGISG